MPWYVQWRRAAVVFMGVYVGRGCLYVGCCMFHLPCTRSIASAVTYLSLLVLASTPLDAYRTIERRSDASCSAPGAKRKVVHAMVKRPSWKFGCALAGALCLLVLMSCVLTGVGIQRREVPPPNLDLALGGLRILAYTTKRPGCPPYGGRPPPISIPCSTDSLFPSEEAYTVWMLARTRQRLGAPRTTFRRLLLLPMR
jgi:hypothetical protein